MENHEVIKKALDGSLKEFIFREGKAPDLLPEKPKKEVKALEIKGKSGTCQAFLNSRSNCYNSLACHAKVNKDAGTITLVLNEKQENDQHIDLVQSVYKINEKILRLGINSGTGYKAKDLFTLLRPYKMYATNKQEFQNLLNQLTNFTAKVTAEISQVDNKNGKFINGISKEVLHSIPESFTLQMPILENSVAHFTVNIEFNGQNEMFELYSDEFIEKLENITDSAMFDEIASIAAFCLVVSV